MGKYDDIIDMSHYRSAHRTPMPLENRAAQFAPFAALSGHDEAICETSRITDSYIELSNEDKLNLSKSISVALASRRLVKITYFVPDGNKAGGKYAEASGCISKVNETDRLVILDNGIAIPLDNLHSFSFLPNHN